MKCLRLSIAILLLRGAGIIAELVAGPAVSESAPDRAPLRPAEQILLGSIVGLAICALWIWFAGRAGR